MLTLLGYNSGPDDWPLLNAILIIAHSQPIVDLDTELVASVLILAAQFVDEPAEVRLGLGQLQTQPLQITDVVLQLDLRNTKHPV